MIRMLLAPFCAGIAVGLGFAAVILTVAARVVRLPSYDLPPSVFTKGELNARSKKAAN